MLHSLILEVLRLYLWQPITHSPPSSAEVKDQWGYACATTCVHTDFLLLRMNDRDLVLNSSRIALLVETLRSEIDFCMLQYCILALYF